MNRGARKAPVFFDHDCCDLFLRLLGELPGRYNVLIHGYALMPNHFHLLLQTPNGNLSRAMGYLSSRYARELNRTHEWDGPLFKGRFKNKVVENLEYWRHLLAYIHLNPVRGGLAPRLDEADWTSHAPYIDPEYAPEWLHRSEMVELYGTPEAYFDYLKQVQNGRVNAPDGFERAVLWIERVSGENVVVPEVRPTGTIEEIFGAVLPPLCETTGLTREELLVAPRGRTGNPARWVLVWWLRRRVSRTVFATGIV